MALGRVVPIAMARFLHVQALAILAILLAPLMKNTLLLVPALVLGITTANAQKALTN